MTFIAAVKHFQSISEFSHVHFDEVEILYHVGFFLCKNIHCFKRDLRELRTFSNSAHGQLGEPGVLLTLHPVKWGWLVQGFLLLLLYFF